MFLFLLFLPLLPHQWEILLKIIHDNLHHFSPPTLLVCLFLSMLRVPFLYHRPLLLLQHLMIFIPCCSLELSKIFTATPPRCIHLFLPLLQHHLLLPPRKITILGFLLYLLNPRHTVKQSSLNTKPSGNKR